ncbi:lasso peptide [Pleurocapsa sp. CCALA 161]|uniref:lasso peptide n=1 Tax=Pleurocapsa sp. CCALA 161 TaxID=2107688 RepID=UPI001304C6FF|nr:lasso peptide [Pleurocapsa sp. CCALA 161]
MKTKYSTPKLTAYGNIDTVTQARGPSPVQDSIIVNGTTLGIPTDGSGDVTINT